MIRRTVSRKNGIPGRADDRLVEAHAALVEGVGGVGLDGSVRAAAPLRRGSGRRSRVEAIGRLEEGRGLEREANPVGLLEALGRGQHRRERPAIALSPLGPAFRAAIRLRTAFNCAAGEAVALPQIGLRTWSGKRP